MRKLILKMSMTVDGFVCGPNGEIDWLFRSSDPESRAWTVDAISGGGVHAMGRKSFNDMAAYWPTADSPFAAPMNEIPKVVFTRQGLDPADLAKTSRALEDARKQGEGKVIPSAAAVASWTNPQVARGDLVTEMTKLKSEAGGDIIAHGGASFAQSLVEHDLVDEYRLPVHPVVLGRGKPLFTKAPAAMDLQLVETRGFSKGIVVHVYRRAR